MKKLLINFLLNEVNFKYNIVLISASLHCSNEEFVEIIQNSNMSIMVILTNMLGIRRARELIGEVEQNIPNHSSSLHIVADKAKEKPINTQVFKKCFAKKMILGTINNKKIKNKKLMINNLEKIKLKNKLKKIINKEFINLIE